MAEDDRGRRLDRFGSATIDKYESFGAHVEAHTASLEAAVDFLRAVDPGRIRARAFALTRRWTRRAERMSGFRPAVTIDPLHCAGLVAFDVESVERERLYTTLRTHGIIAGGTESDAGVFGIPDDAPRSLVVVNTGMATSLEDVDRLASALEALA